jgi:hypothetical protein
MFFGFNLNVETIAFTNCDSSTVLQSSILGELSVHTDTTRDFAANSHIWL